ncbi:Olfactory Receptor 14K1, partial [Manis pentadactyla]
MSHDHYVAICLLLHYDIIMSRAMCVKMAAASWVLESIIGVLYSAGNFPLSFCGSRKLPQFFCDVPSLLKISCSEIHCAIDVSVAFRVIYGFSVQVI